jgi:hypothetical protein
MWADAGHRGIKKARIAAVGGYIYSRTFYWMQSGLKSKSLETVGGAQQGCHNVSQAYKNEHLSKPMLKVKAYFGADAFFNLS